MRFPQIVAACAVALVCMSGAGAPASSPDRYWRVTGHFQTAEGRRFDAYAIFDESNVSHGDRFLASAFSIVDETTRHAVTATRLERCSDGLARETSDRDLAIDGWRFSESPPPERRGQQFSLNVENDETSLAFVARSIKVPIAGAWGVSFTRLIARGRLVFEGRTFAVSGTAWVDRAVANPRGAKAERRSLFEIQYDDGREVMLTVARTANGSNDPNSTGFLAARDGTVTRLSRRDFGVENPVETTFTSPRTGIRYPSLWEIFSRRARLDSAVVPPVQDQEIARLDGPAFYAGTVDVERAPPPGGDFGRGYVESTGYDALRMIR
jgi:predicted secreted hydrolase